MRTFYQPRNQQGTVAKKILQDADIEFRTVMMEADEDPKIIDSEQCFPWNRMSGVRRYAAAFSEKQAA